MDRIAFFVDAGYVFSGGSLLLTGRNLKRGELNLDADKLLSLLALKAKAVSGLPLLRVYWYDGTATGATPFQLSMAHRNDVKIRLGIVNVYGQQKGVDSLIVTDLINLARNRGMADVLLVTGDEDIRVGVQQAQEFGVRVHLLGIDPCTGSGVSALLRQESDTFTSLSRAEVASFLTPTPKAAPAEVAAPAAAAEVSLSAVEVSLSHGEVGLTGGSVAGAVPGPPIPAEGGPADPIMLAARKLAGELRASDVLLAANAAGALPLHIDRQLLAVAGKRLGQMSPETKSQLRQSLKVVCREKVAAGLR